MDIDEERSERGATPEARVEAHLAMVTAQAVNAARPLFDERSPEARRRAMELLLSYEEQTKGALVAALARDPRCLPVCAPGCAFCCHLSVFAAVPEILHLAEHLRGALSAPDLAALSARVAAAAAAIAELSQEGRARAKRACPLLDEATGRCGVYAARPLACRAYNSCDAGVCERAYANALTRWEMPVNLFQLTVSRNVRTGLMAAVFAAGLNPGPYELACGLSVALEVPDAEARWLAGEPIFAAAETRIGRERRAGWRASLARSRRRPAPPRRDRAHERGGGADFFAYSSARATRSARSRALRVSAPRARTRRAPRRTRPSFAEQIAAHARQQVIARERRLVAQRVDEREPRRRTERHRRPRPRD